MTSEQRERFAEMCGRDDTGVLRAVAGRLVALEAELAAVVPFLALHGAAGYSIDWGPGGPPPPPAMRVEWVAPRYEFVTVPPATTGALSVDPTELPQ